MYAAKKGGEVLKTGARAIRYRDMQTAITAAFKYAVKQCRALSETDIEPDRTRCGSTETAEDFQGCARWPVDNRFGAIEIENEKTHTIAARITARFYNIEGIRTVGYEHVKSPYGRTYETPIDERFTGVRFSLTTEVLEPAG